MSWLRRVIESRKTPTEALDDGTYGVPGFGSWGQGMVWEPGASGGSAMRISAVYACIRLLTDAIATLPADTYTRRGAERIEYPKPRYLRFDFGLTRAQYLTQTMMAMLTDGNAFSYVLRSRRGIEELIPLDPTKVEVRRGKRRDVEFVIGERVFSTQEIIHIPALVGAGGLRGMSPIGVAREVIDIAGEAQRHGGAYFQNASVPPAVIQIPAAAGTAPNQGSVDAERAKRIAKAWHETHGGTSNAGKVGVLVGGAELKTVAVPNKDAQWLESRQFSVQEVARIFGVPPHLVGDASGSTSWGSGLASQNLTFGQFTLRPWIERIENAHNRLLSQDGLVDVFWKLNLDALLRASLDDRYSSYAMGIRSGFLTPNEARAWEELPPVEGGDEVLRIPVGASPQQGPDDAEEGDDDDDDA